MSEKEATLALTPSMLKELVASAVTAAIAEVRKPTPPSDEQLAITDQKQKMRQQTADQIVEIIHNKRSAQMRCTHEHSRREGGGTHCVYVREENPQSPGYIFCQLCMGRFRAGLQVVPGGRRLATCRIAGPIFAATVMIARPKLPPHQANFEVEAARRRGVFGVTGGRAAPTRWAVCLTVSCFRYHQNQSFRMSIPPLSHSPHFFVIFT